MDADLFLTDILAEPAALAATIDAYAGADSPLAALGQDPLADGRVVLLGMGSSRYASLNAAAEMRARGLWAVAEYASADRGTPPDEDVVAIAISASGGSAETLAAIEPHLGISRTIAVTNDPDSELARCTDAVLPLLAGPEMGGVACRSFQATLAVLLMLAGVGADELRPAAETQAELLDRRGEWAQELLSVVGEGHTVYTVAPADRIASALQAALMLREGPRIPAVGTETGDWSHVDVYLTKHPGYRAIVFGGSAHEPEMLEWMSARGAQFAAIGRVVPGAALHIPFDSASDHWVSQLVETSVVEVLAAHWWQARIAAGTMP